LILTRVIEAGRIGDNKAIPRQFEAGSIAAALVDFAKKNVIRILLQN